MIPFNKPYLTGKELHYISVAHSRGQLAGDGYFTKKCSEWLELNTGCHKALLTHSCTAALEMAAILANIQKGDEVIMPSYTFVSTANAFVLRGGVPVFVDIREDTLNIDESLIEAAITPRTKAIVPVHYAGVACEMDTIMAIARNYNLLVIEDAAQGVMATYKGRALGSIGDIGCYSFHETKNIIAGEGGVILLNKPHLEQKAYIIRDKGTNRNQFNLGMVDKYSWVDVGSSFLPAEMVAAFLYAQLQHSTDICGQRLEAWRYYHRAFKRLEEAGVISRPMIPNDCAHNGHIYYLILPAECDRSDFLSFLAMHNVNAVFHYIPLHNSPYIQSNLPGLSAALAVTEDLSSRLVRLPLWPGIKPYQSDVVEVVFDYFR